MLVILNKASRDPV